VTSPADQKTAQSALTTIMEAAGEDLTAFMKYEAPTPLPELQKARLLRAVKKLVETAPPEMGFPGRGGKLLYPALCRTEDEMLELADTLKGGMLAAFWWPVHGRELAEGAPPEKREQLIRYIEEKSGMPRDEWVNDTYPEPKPS
jgi:hypothetical protein